jgi:hypothetical protein
VSGLAVAACGPSPTATGTGGRGGGVGVGGAGGTGGVGGAGGTSGTGGTVGTGHDHCAEGFHADAGDAQLTGLPDEWRSTAGEIDLVLPRPVLNWMGARVWEKSHDAWHNVRRCRGGFALGGAICSNPAVVIPPDQECANAQDGYAFLVMHRHMIQGLKQAFPQHTQLFTGFPRFPFNATDVPEQWRSRWGTGWSAQILSVANTLEAIERNVGQFATEGDLGRYMQCGTGIGGASSIHGALHFKWVVNSSPYSLGKQPVNIDNYMFWKLHGWIDNVWERYRVAKGLTPSEPKLKQALIEQCHEMENLGKAVAPDNQNPDLIPVERGYFHESVRPILEKYCSGCHSESSPEAGLPLGGKISSANIVSKLVNVRAVGGGQFNRVVPGNPNQSWIYLKVSGGAASAGCTGACRTGVMPPAGQVTLTQTELGIIRQWITSGAPAPTQ